MEGCESKCADRQVDSNDDTVGYDGTSAATNGDEKQGGGVGERLSSTSSSSNDDN